MDMADISPFGHFKCIDYVTAAGISSVTLLYKLRNATEKVVFQRNVRSQNSLKGLPCWKKMTLMQSQIQKLRKQTDYVDFKLRHKIA